MILHLIYKELITVYYSYIYKHQKDKIINKSGLIFFSGNHDDYRILYRFLVKVLDYNIFTEHSCGMKIIISYKPDCGCRFRRYNRARGKGNA